MEGAAAVDAAKVLSIAEDDMTFITADVMLSGRDTIMARERSADAVPGRRPKKAAGVCLEGRGYSVK